MSIRTSVLIAAIWVLGAAWILIPHPDEGEVIWVISARYGLGVHSTDLFGIVVPALVSIVLVGRGRRRRSGS